MSDLRAILLAVEMATRQRDDLAKALLKTRRSADFASDQMGQLEGYAGDTDARWTGSATAGLSTELIRHHYQFMDRLQQAIALQRDVMAASQRQIEAAEKSLLAAEFRLAGLTRVLEARRTAKQLVVQRREQRLTDEFAAMLHSRTKANAMNGEVR